MGRKPPNAGKGRKKGSKNRAAKDVREAIARVLDSNTENFSRWLASVADGEKEYRYDDEGKAVKDDKGEHMFDWLRRPEPGNALKLALEMTEFQFPKLARLTHDGGVSVKHSLTITDD